MKIPLRKGQYNMKSILEEKDVRMGIGFVWLRSDGGFV
jgi:hypothetical protein